MKKQSIQLSQLFEHHFSSRRERTIIAQHEMLGKLHPKDERPVGSLRIVQEVATLVLRNQD
jgi:hypothetical protein